MDHADDPLFARATLGIEADKFLSGRVGQYVISRAEEEIEAAYKALAVVDPDDTGLVRTLQSRIAVARAVPNWLGLAIADGIQAEAGIQEEEAYE